MSPAIFFFAGGGGTVYNGGGGNSAPVNTVAPAISGSPRVGSPSMSSVGTWTGTPAPTFTYQWRIATTSGGTYSNISGATSSTYTPQEADEGKYLKVRVTGTNSEGSATEDSAYSGPIGEAVELGAMEKGANIHNSAYWLAHKNFIDINRDSSRTEWGVDTGSPTFSDDGATITLPNNAQVRLYVVGEIQSGNVFRSGTYIIKAVDTPQRSGVATMGLTLGANFTSGITGLTPGANRAQLTTASDRPAWAVTVKNETGSSKTFHTSNIVCVHADDEALFDAGEIFAPALKKALAGHSTLRFLDPLDTNETLFTDPTQLPTMQTWVAGTWPVEICMRLCKEVGAIPWINLPIVKDNYKFNSNSSTDRVEAVVNGSAITCPWAEGDPIMFYNADQTAFFDGAVHKNSLLYVRNVSGTTFQLSTSPSGGSIIDITGDRTHDWDDVLTGVYDPTAVWSEMLSRAHDEWPDCPKIFTEAGNEAWLTFWEQWQWCRTVGYWFQYGTHNATGTGYAYGGIWSHRKAWKLTQDEFGVGRWAPQFNAQVWPGGMGDTPGTLIDNNVFNDGKCLLEQIRDYGGEAALAPYMWPAHDTIGDYGVYEGWTYSELVAAECWDWTDSYWKSQCANCLLTYDIHRAQWQALIDEYAPGMRLSCYEMGQHMFMNVGSRSPGDDPSKIFTAWTNFWFHSATSDAQDARDDYLAWFANNGFNRILHYTLAGHWLPDGNQLMAWGMTPTYAVTNEWSETFNQLGTLNEARVFLSGHSLLPNPTDVSATDYCEQMADSHGLGYQFEMQTIGGSSIGQRVGDPPSWAGLSDGGNKSGSDLDLRAEWASPSSITGTYTHFLVTERHGFPNQLKWSDTLHRLMAMYEAFTSRNPGAKFYLWSCWYDGWDFGKSINDAGQIDAWIAYLRAEQPVWDAIVARVNLTLENRGRPDRMLSAPANFMLAELIDQAVNGTLPGVTKGSFADTMDYIFDDSVHLYGPGGRYYFDLMQYVTLYRRSPVGVWYPTTGANQITEQEALSLQKVCWESFLEYEATKTVPTMSAARTYITGTYKTAAEAYLGSGNSMVSDAFFNRTTYTPDGDDAITPLYFDAGTDEASAGWLGVP